LAEFDAYASEYRELVDRSVRFTGESSRYFAAYKAAYIARRVAPGPGCKILDYGCGVGLLSQELKKQLKEVRVDGFDVSPESVQHLDADLRSNGKFSSNLTELDADYDVVVLANVLHHVEPSRRADAIHEAASRLTPGGKLVVFEHNPLNPLTRRAVALCPFDEGVVLLQRKETVAHFGANHLRVIAHDYIVFFPRWLAWFRPLEWSLAWCALGAQYTVVGEKIAR
jgi:2-polyprenyl-3-methyl-5-hydroxy-6-metoxy-1,4-benzoquinol methylase